MRIFRTSKRGAVTRMLTVAVTHPLLQAMAVGMDATRIYEFDLW